MPDRAAIRLFYVLSLVIHCALFIAFQGVKNNNNAFESFITVDLKTPGPVAEAKPGIKQAPQRMTNHLSTIKRSPDYTAPRNNPPMAHLSDRLPRLPGSKPLPTTNLVRQADVPALSTSTGLDRSVSPSVPESGQGTAVVLKANSFQQQNGPNALSGSEQDEHFAYLALIRSLLEKNKEYPALARRAGIEGTVLVRFSLDRKGMIRQADISGTSGKSLLDQAAMRFVKSAARFPPLPESVKGNGMTLEVPIIYKLDDANSQ
jgi:protein TonB